MQAALHSRPTRLPTHPPPQELAGLFERQAAALAAGDVAAAAEAALRFAYYWWVAG